MQRGLTSGIHVEAPHLQVFLEVYANDQQRSQLREQGQLDGGAGIKIGKV